jgi:hypothetical protein
MNMTEFIETVISRGIAAAKKDYDKPEQSDKLKGSLEGFELCRGKNPKQLEELLAAARNDTIEAHRNQATDYWVIRCREVEIEWVCNVVSAVLANQGFQPIVATTARGVLMANDIFRSEGCLTPRDETPAET